MLTKEAILKANDSATEKVEVPEWGGEVCVRVMTAGERDAFEAEIVEQKERNGKLTPNLRAKLAALCICDEHGKRLFGRGDVEALAQKSAAALQRVFNVAQRINKITKEDVEELEKN